MNNQVERKQIRKKSTAAKFLSITMCIVMILGMMSVPAFADDPPTQAELDADFITAVDGVMTREAPASGSATEWQIYLNSRFYTSVGGGVGTWSPRWNLTNTAPKWNGDKASGATDAPGAETEGTLTMLPYTDNAMGMTTYYVWSGEQFRYAMEECAKTGGYIKIMKDIDLNGQGGKRWKGISLSTKTVTIDGNNKTIYNLCSIGENTGASLISLATGAFVMKDLSFNSTIMCGKAANGETNYNHGTGIVAHAGSANIIFDNVNLTDCFFIGSFYVGGLVGRLDGVIGTDTTKYIKNCSIENSICFGDTHVGSLTGSLVNVNDVRNCYSVGSKVFSVGGHSGGLFACCGNAAFENCFADVEVYGDHQTGVFTGVANNGSTFNSCFSSGFIEGTNRLGGFIGNVDRGVVNTTNCYSTALVGIRSQGFALGGFVGHVGLDTSQTTLSMDSCYAAGEVGSSDAELQETSGTVINRTGTPSSYTVSYQPQLFGGMVGAVSYGVTPGAAGFGAANWYSNFNAEKCYYDKQTTAMREFAIGVAGKNTGNGAAIDYSGIKGVLTTETNKAGAGLMDNPAASGFDGFTDNDVWDFSTGDHYPELSVFKNAETADWGDARKAALARAYSKSSTAGVQLETWDKEVEISTGHLTVDSNTPTTYDTTRDIVSGFPLTSTMINKWDRIGNADSNGTTGMTCTIAGETYPVLDLKYQNDIYLCDELTSGIEWLKVSVEDKYMDSNNEEQTVTATRRVRVIPTSAIDAGESVVITGNLYDHADDVKLLFSTAERLDTGVPVPGDSYDVTTGIFPDRSDVAAMAGLAPSNALTARQINLMQHGRSLIDESAVNDFFDSGNDEFSNLDITFMQKDPLTDDNTSGSKLYFYLYKVNSIDENGKIITDSEPIDLSDTNQNNSSVINPTYEQELNGYTPLPNSDEQYLLAYVWKLADGRSLMDAKLLRTAEVPFDVNLNVYKDSIAESNLYTGYVSTYVGEETVPTTTILTDDAAITEEISAYQNAAAAWKPANTMDKLRSIKLTMDYSGNTYTTTVDYPVVGNDITVDFVVYRIVYQNNGYYTIKEHVKRTYELKKTTDDVYYLVFDKDRSTLVKTYNADGSETGRTTTLDDVENDIRVDVVYEEVIPAEITSEELNVTKTITGDVLYTAKAFEFTIERTDSGDADAVTMPTDTTITTAAITNGSTGPIGFDDIVFNAEGIYTFRISETASGITGMTDALPQVVTIKVVDNNNTLQASIIKSATDETASSGALTFVNDYDTPPATTAEITSENLNITKTITGNALNIAKAFEFTIERTDNGDADAVTMPTDTTITTAAITNGSTGPIGFDDIVFNAEGIYTFRISETASGITGMTDALPQVVTIKVVDNNNTLQASIIKSATDETASSGALTFVNNYDKPSGPTTPNKPEITVTKASVHVIDGNTNQITYTLTAKNTGKVNAIGVYIRDYIPEYTHFVSVDAKGKYGVQDGKEYVSYFIEKLEAGKTVVMTFTVSVDVCMPDNTLIRNMGQYEITGSTTPPSSMEELNNSTNIVEDKPEVVLSGTGTAILTKVDENDRSTTLSEARFQLFRVVSDTVHLIGTRTTDRNGEISIDSLPAGSYYWVEIGSPAAYKLDATKHEFTISENDISKLTVTNKRSDVPEWLNGIDHFAYIIGYPEGDVRPVNNITRAEVATIFFRLLDDSVRDRYMTQVNTFSDVNEGMWFNCAISTLSAMGIIDGYPDGTFNPNGSITRAEFAAFAARFDANGNSSPASFYDIYEHWGCKEISIAANNGWVLGYEDGTFCPDQEIKRSEAMAMVDRVLQRVPQFTFDLLDSMVKWMDNADTAEWYYIYVQEATNSHFFDRKLNGYETWTALRPVRDWESFEK